MIRDKLIAAGVRNLREFGYPHVTADNLLTDEVYSAFFASMLRDNKGNGVDTEIDALLSELAA